MTTQPLTVSDDQLNRATLARQLLLRRVDLDPITAISRLCALQAQEPASPYIALWTRLANFRPERLDDAIQIGAIVKATLMRMTLHAVAAEDYPAFWAAHVDYLRAARTTGLRFLVREVARERIDELVASAAAFATEPRSNAEMAAHLEELAGPLGEQDWWWAVRGFTPVLRAPCDEPWSFARRPSYVTPATPASKLTADEALEYVVHSYLAAFGPATVLDVAQFVKLPRAPVRRAVDRIAPTLDVLHGEQGQTLYDVPGGPIPTGDTTAPARFLPMWDSALMAYADRSRIIPADVRRHVIRQNGDVLPTFLVDGRVAGVWLPQHIDGRPAIQVTPFRPLGQRDWRELADEAAALIAFLTPREPAAYRRYARWWTVIPSTETRTLPG